MIDHEERARLRALCEAATPGPWTAKATERGGDHHICAPRDAEGYRIVVAVVDAAALVSDVIADAALIAAARTAIPALLDALETAERDEARAEVERLRARLHRCAQCGADDSAVAACEGDEYPLCGPCATHALREARADAVAAREHTDREVTEIFRTLPSALRLAAEDEREACAAIADDYAAQEDVAGADACARLADAIRARGAGGAR